MVLLLQSIVLYYKAVMCVDYTIFILSPRPLISSFALCRAMHGFPLQIYKKQLLFYPGKGDPLQRGFAC